METDGFETLIASIRASLATQTLQLTGVGPLFRVQRKNLYGAFLGALPPELHQHYNCSTCARFVNRYGGLVTIDDSGDQRPVLWDPSSVPPVFKSAVMVMHDIVLHDQVSRVFLSTDDTWGTPQTEPDKKTGRVWSHMAVFRELYT